MRSNDDLIGQYLSNNCICSLLGEGREGGNDGCLFCRGPWINNEFPVDLDQSINEGVNNKEMFTASSSKFPEKKK